MTETQQDDDNADAQHAVIGLATARQEKENSMQLLTHIQRRRISRLALGLAVAAFMAPAAHAALIPGQGGDPGFYVRNVANPVTQIAPIAKLTPAQLRHLPAFSYPIDGSAGGQVTVGHPKVAHLRTFSYSLGSVGGKLTIALPSVPVTAPVTVLTPSQAAHLPTFATPVNPALYNPGTAGQPKSSPVSGFSWGDAGVGIGIGAALMLLLGTGLAVGRRRGGLAGA